MIPSRLALLIVIGCCLLRSEPLFADDVTSPFSPDAQFSADMITTAGKGMTFTTKLYCDKGKMRMEMATQGMHIISIVRPDLKKIYSVMVDQKMVTEMPFDP